MTEMELKLTGGRIVFSEVKDGILKVIAEKEVEGTELSFEVLKNEEHGQFVLVEASSLKLTDDFMYYTPIDWRDSFLKDLLIDVIKKGIPDFYRPRLDPSLDKNYKIYYQPGMYPAVSGSMPYSWWEEQAKAFWPERNSRLGTRYEYVAFLGILIKKLVESGWKVNDAWYAVCWSSEKLGNYSARKDENYRELEPTGSRYICGFYDLANTYKILAAGSYDCYYVAGGSHLSDYFERPLAAGIDRPMFRLNGRLDNSVGWLILEK